MLLEPDEQRLRRRVLAHLRRQGFIVRNGRILAPVVDDKERLRSLHRAAVDENVKRAQASLAPKEDAYIASLAAGSEIDPTCVSPQIIPITDKRSFDAQLWRWCTLHWSIPISPGYGRRMRFLIVDRAHNGAVIGLIGLADPVYALRCRDEWIGWQAEDRVARLTSVMDAFVLGAVPPYSGLIGGKLIALLSTSDEVRQRFARQYGHSRTVIRERDPDARLSLITTTSALGRSSTYNRLTRPDGSLAFAPVGFTSGTGDFHFTGAIYDELSAFAASITPPDQTHRHARWGMGFRNRREVIQRGLYGLGFDGSAMRTHGIRRQVFVAALMRNSAKYLRGDSRQVRWQTLPAATLTNWWLQRWAVPRSQRTDEWRAFVPETWRIWK